MLYVIRGVDEDCPAAAALTAATAEIKTPENYLTLFCNGKYCELVLNPFNLSGNFALEFYM